MGAVVLSVVTAFVSGAAALPPDTDITFDTLSRHAGLIVLTASAVVATVVAVLVTVTAGVGGVRRAAASGTLPRHFESADDDERALILERLQQQRKSRILFASLRAGVAGIASGCSIAAAIVFLLTYPHPSSPNSMATTFVLFVSAITFAGAAGIVLSSAISPAVRDCADAVAAEPQLAYKPWRAKQTTEPSTHQSG